MGGCFAKSRKKEEKKELPEPIVKSISEDSAGSVSLRSGSSESESSRRKRTNPAHKVLGIIVPEVSHSVNFKHLPSSVGVWWQFEDEARQKDKNEQIDRALVTALILRAHAINFGFVVVLYLPQECTKQGLTKMAESIYTDQTNYSELIEVTATIEIVSSKSAARIQINEDNAKMLSTFSMHPLTELEGKKIYIETPAIRSVRSFEMLVQDVCEFVASI